jgi:hypothetical protein
MFEHLPLHSIQLVLNCVGYMRMDIVLQDDAIIVYPDICSWSWYAAFEGFDSIGLNLLCCYVIPEAEVPRCPCGAS